MASRKFSRILLATVLGLIIVFGLLPMLVVAISSFTSASYASFPPDGWSVRWYEAFFATDELVSSLALSFFLAAASGLIATVLGSLVAFAIVRFDFRGASAIQTFALSPTTIPHVVLGLALLQLFGQLGLVANFWTLLAGHVAITTPFAFRMVASSLAGIGRRYERAAMSLGASYVYTVTRVTLPMIRTGLIGAFCLAAVISFDDVAISYFLSGVGTQTISVKLYSLAAESTTPVLASTSTILMVIGVLGLLVVGRVLKGVDRAFR